MKKRFKIFFSIIFSFNPPPEPDVTSFFFITVLIPYIKTVGEGNKKCAGGASFFPAKDKSPEYGWSFR